MPLWPGMSATAMRSSIGSEDKILEDMANFIREKRDGIRRSLHLMRVANNLERVADISTNICEEVIYIVEGKDIKHHKGDSPDPATGI